MSKIVKIKLSNGNTRYFTESYQGGYTKKEILQIARDIIKLAGSKEYCENCKADLHKIYE